MSRWKTRASRTIARTHTQTPGRNPLASPSQPGRHKKLHTGEQHVRSIHRFRCLVLLHPVAGVLPMGKFFFSKDCFRASPMFRHSRLFYAFMHAPFMHAPFPGGKPGRGSDWPIPGFFIPSCIPSSQISRRDDNLPLRERTSVPKR